MGGMKQKRKRVEERRRRRRRGLFLTPGKAPGTRDEMNGFVWVGSRYGKINIYLYIYIYLYLEISPSKGREENGNLTNNTIIS